MKAMILAAGLGSRMRPLTLTTPKPLLAVKGKPLIVRHIERLVQAGITEIVINVSHLGEQIMTTLGDGAAYQVALTYSVEATPLETAGGIVKALPKLGDQPFLCVNGDIWTDYDFAGCIDAQSSEGYLLSASGSLAHLVLVDNPVHHPDGDFALSSTPQPEGRCSVTQNGGSKLTFSGISVLNPQLFTGLDEDAGRLAPVLRAAMDQSLVTGEHFEGFWCDVGTPERLEQLNKR